MNELDTAAAWKGPPPRPLLPAPDRDIPELAAAGRTRGTGRIAAPAARPRRASALVRRARLWAYGGITSSIARSRHTAEQQADFVPDACGSRRWRSVSARVHVTLPATTLGLRGRQTSMRAPAAICKALCRYRRSRQGRAAARRDHRARDRGPDRAIPEQRCRRLRRRSARTKPNDLGPGHLGTRRDTRQAGLGDAAAGRQRSVHFTGPAARDAGGSIQCRGDAGAAEYFNQQKAYQRVVAPFDGVITQRNIDVGSLITADATSGTSMFSMVQSDVIRVWVYVPQDDAFGVEPGVDAVIRVPAMPNLTFHGKVTRIADALQPGTRTLLTEIDVPNPDGAFSPGIYCTVELKIPRTSPALIIPASAIIFDQNGMQVAVVENGIAHLHKIAITTDYGTEVEVNSGVKAGDQVILQPPIDLIDGQKVQVTSSS